MPGVANWECSGVHHRVALEECISIWYFGSCLLFVFWELSIPALFWSLLGLGCLELSTPGFLGALQPGDFLDLSTVVFFRSTSLFGYFGALQRGVFWELSTVGLFGSSPPRGSLEHFTILILRALSGLVFLSGILQHLAFLECFTAPPCWSASPPPGRSASPRGPGGVHQHLALWEPFTIWFFGALDRGAFLEPSIAWVFWSTVPWSCLGALHAYAFSDLSTLGLFQSV